jgi:WD40 repeat protein
MKETDLNSVSISNDRYLIAAGDNLGTTKLFLYPAYLPHQSYLSLDYGHQRAVKCVKFLKDDSFMVTIGEEDNTIMLWAYKAYTLYRSSS